MSVGILTCTNGLVLISECTRPAYVWQTKTILFTFYDPYIDWELLKKMSSLFPWNNVKEKLNHLKFSDIDVLKSF